MSDMFFVYDGTCFDTFPTLEEARSEADRALQAEKDDAQEGWGGAVENICYGELRGHIVKTVDRPWSHDDVGPLTPGIDRFVDYELQAAT